MKRNISEIISVSKEIYEKGLVSGKSGNVSARFGNVVAITPTSKSLSQLSEDEIVLVDMDGNVLTKGVPSSEVNMHLEIYKKRSDVNAIVHTHSPYATGFAFSNKKLKRMEGMGKIKSPYIASIEYEKPGSKELAMNAAAAVNDENVLILKRHGIICLSDSLKEGILLAEFIEESAKTQFVSYMLNSAEDID